MRIQWKSDEDRANVWNGYRQAIRQRDAGQRDRFNVVMLLCDGGPGREELKRTEIAAAVGRSRQFVDQWRRRYLKGGFAFIIRGKAKGRVPKLDDAQVTRLKARLDAGPRDQDGVCTLRGVDIVRIIKEEIGVIHTLGGIYDVLKRIGYCSLAPRPSHRKKDPKAVADFVDSAPFLSRA